ncbi:Hypothetical protein, putative [Bodo saltans]|uniref:C2 domain-containing protein n=1 Tax=Bodo saltans TaxID=75058 RepID=A0A0S4J3V5_BODSA|nr:Hypothetical protein, putative [Bodo saltans]|eukprot:CUG80314.1 Hypothetical protein, putative [Bodo saltans]
MSSSRRSDNDDTATTIGLDNLFDEVEARSPHSVRTDGSGGGGASASSSNGGGGIRAADLEKLSRMVDGDESQSSASTSPPKSVKTVDDGSSSSYTARKNAAVEFEDDDDDDATSVATSKVFVEGEEWISVGDDSPPKKPGGTTEGGKTAPPAAVRSDGLSSWPADKVSALWQHMLAAPWHDVRYRLQTFHKGMTGEEIVSWLKSANFAKTDGEAQEIAAAMLARHMFYQLNRRSKFQGFAATAKQQYTLEDNFTEENASLSSKISRAVKSSNESAATVPFKLIKGNHVVTVLIEERQRRPDPSLPYSPEFVRPQIDGPAWSMQKSAEGNHVVTVLIEERQQIDGPAWSMQKSAVPVPPVDDESPDMCEWVAEDWELVVSEGTDEHGWRYSLDFKDPVRFVRGDAANKNFLVRLREWSRPARKRIEKKSERADAGEDKKVEVEGPTEAELEEERKKELLSKAAVSIARLARSGTLEMHVTHGKDLLVVKDSYVVVEHGKGASLFKDRIQHVPKREAPQLELQSGHSYSKKKKRKDLLVVKDSYVVVEHGKGASLFKDRSNTCPREKCHNWNYKVDIPIQSDLDGVIISIFQEGTLGRGKCLGTARLDIDANALANEGSVVLKSKQKDDDDEDRNASSSHSGSTTTDDVGEVFFTWTFNPTGTEVHRSSAIKRCILNVTIEKAIGLTREKKRIGPCGVPVPGKGGKEKLHVFFKARYFGEYCEMQCQSTPIKFVADLDVNWSFSALAMPSIPAVIEYWHSDLATPVGQFVLEYNDNGEQVVEMELKRCGIEGLPQHSSAGGNLGKVQVKLQWLPEEDPLNLAALGVDVSFGDKQRNLVSIWA